MTPIESLQIHGALNRVIHKAKGAALPSSLPRIVRRDLANPRNIRITDPVPSNYRSPVMGRGFFLGACSPCRQAGLGALGIGGSVTSALQYGSLGAKTISFIPGIGPIAGAIIGGVAGAAAGKIHTLISGPEGDASKVWDDIVGKRSLFSIPGSGFEERYWSEALKGMMDKNSNLFPKCGSARHEGPDCLMQPLAALIVQGYKAGLVQPGASTQQVYGTVVLPWLQSGANGLVNWGPLATLPQQQLMIQSAVDRYINGLPITRGDMPWYQQHEPGTIASGGYLHAPSLQSALASIQAASAPVQQTTAAPSQPSGSYTIIGTVPNSPGVPVYRDSAGALWTYQSRSWVPYSGQVLAPAPASGGQALPPPAAAGGQSGVSTAPPAPTAAVTVNVPPQTGSTAGGAVTVAAPVQTPSGIDATAMINQLLAQGASQQQAFVSALQAVSAQGVQPTPQVQQQVAGQVEAAAAVKPATAGLSGNMPLIIAGGLSVLAVIFATARPKRSN